MCPIDQILIVLVLVTIVKKRIRIQMVSLDRNREFSLADEVHEGLLLIGLVLLCLILLFCQLPV